MQLSRTNPKADRSSFWFRFGVLVLSLTSLKRSFHSVTISLEIGDLDRSVRVERSLISVKTCSCGRTRDRTLGRDVTVREGTRLFATGCDCSLRDATFCDWTRLFTKGRDCLRLGATVRDGTRLFATGCDCSLRDATFCDWTRLFTKGRDCLRLGATVRDGTRLFATGRDWEARDWTWLSRTGAHRITSKFRYFRK
ncbi:hypothetical protein CRG98_040722 [Punica granatum]|uniref:Uncharacterized protein n=1 Tax=Punica granatum TaxID=22663 RepID=A0A2I0I4K0_PUNGR|nr:hypothetical protein CRG98_040722 [Punica granatum]